MYELVNETAHVLVPFLAAGAGSVAGGAAEEAGANVYQATRRLLTKLGGRLTTPDERSVASTLQKALDDGVIDEQDLDAVVNEHTPGYSTSVRVKKIKAKNVFNGTTHIDDFHA